MVDNIAQAAMPVTQHVVSCRRCGHEGVALRTGPFGLQRNRCVQCGAVSTFPLRRRWRIFWWICAVITAVGCVGMNLTLTQGYSWIPGGLGLLAFIALFIDVALRHRAEASPLGRVSVSASGADDVARSDVPASLRVTPAAPFYVAALTALAVCSVIASLLGAAVVTGLNNGYDVDVVLEETQPASQAASFDGTFDFESGEAICGDGDDYYGCIETHRGMYNAICTGSRGWRPNVPTEKLTSSARATCEQLLEFIKSTQKQLEGCGYECTTQADSDGRWGWEYLHPVPHQSMQQKTPARPAITYTDRCWFSLGPIELGRCERSAAEAERAG